MRLTSFLDRVVPSYPAERIHRKDSFWDGKLKQFFVAAISTFILLQLLFLGNLSYVYGSLFQTSTRTHNLNILMVDYDHGIVGQSLRSAAEQLASPSFPSIIESSNSDYPEVEDLIQAVWDGDHYWAAIYTHPNASARLSAALQGGDAAITYNASDAMTYIWLEGRYVTVAQGTVMTSLQRLVGATSVAYDQINGTNAIQSIDISDDSAVNVLLNPITASSVNLSPMIHGTRILQNTISMVLPIVMQFFFLMAINGISSNLQLYSRLPISNNAIIRTVLALSYTFIGSLCMAGYIWAFKEDWNVNGNQFVLTWMILWLYMHITFNVLDCATGFIPMSFMPFFMLTWIIISVTSVLWPFELNPGFYRWGYALPAHETWSVLMTIWTGGAVNQLHIALPVLFAWEVLLLPLMLFALHYRCAIAARDLQDAELKQKSDEAEYKSDMDRRKAGEETDFEDEPSQEARNQYPSRNSTYFPQVPVPFEDTIERITSGRRQEV